MCGCEGKSKIGKAGWMDGRSMQKKVKEGEQHMQFRPLGMNRCKGSKSGRTGGRKMGHEEGSQ